MDVQYINFFSVVFVTFFLSAFIGKKNPIIAAVMCTLLVAFIAYRMNEFNFAIIYYLVLCFISCFFWSVLFRWVTQKNHIDPHSDTLKFIIGFSSGRGDRNTTIISSQKSKIVTDGDKSWERNILDRLGQFRRFRKR
ncbi:hypothetical protein [Desulfospira joergensenii]|uniref:hypothetical protein n=1 Tax=Desulfospira joergensenii TaxID=53329 RepID=UPI0003B3C9D5|nr:hypothetical protein [Desulfospira joergensenii]